MSRGARGSPPERPVAPATLRLVESPAPLAHEAPLRLVESPPAADGGRQRRESQPAPVQRATQTPGRARPRGLLASVGSWLLEPAEPGSEPGAPPQPGLRPVVAVFGLARGCGATTLARALACELAARDPAGVAAVGCPGPTAGLPLGAPAATRLAAVLAELPGAATRALGRLCLVSGVAEPVLADTARHHAPLVLDAGSASVGGVPAAIADHVFLVASPAQEPALAMVVAAGLARLGPEPGVVVSRGGAGARWEGRAHTVLPESRLGAQLALSGRHPRGDIGRVVGELADTCHGSR